MLLWMISDRLLQNDGENEDCYESRADQVECLILGESQLEDVYKTINPSSGFRSNYVVLKSFHIKRMNMKYKILRYYSNIQSFKTLL